MYDYYTLHKYTIVFFINLLMLLDTYLLIHFVLVSLTPLDKGKKNNITLYINVYMQT